MVRASLSSSADFRRKDWSLLAKVVKEEYLFGSLSNLSLTRPPGPGWAHADIIQLISLAPLRELNLNNVGVYRAQSHILWESTDLITAAVEAHGNTLETLGLLRTNIEDEALVAICRGLPRLRKFFFTRGGASAMVRNTIGLGSATKIAYVTSISNRFHSHNYDN